MTDPVTSYNRVPPPFDPESRDSHLDGELGKLEQSTASIIQKIGVLQRDYSTTAQMEAADDALADTLTAAYTAADVVVAAGADDALAAGLAAKAALTHTHAQSDVTGLVASLAGKEPTITAGTTADYLRGDKTWQPLPVVEEWTLVKLATDVSKSSSTAFTDVSTLSFPVAANESYRFRAIIFVYTGGSGVKVAVNGPAGFTKLVAGSSVSVSVAGYDQAITTFASGLLDMQTSIHGVFINGPNAGTLSFRYAQTSSNATAIKVIADSHLEYKSFA